MPVRQMTGANMQDIPTYVPDRWVFRIKDTETNRPIETQDGFLEYPANQGIDENGYDKMAEQAIHQAIKEGYLKAWPEDGKKLERVLLHKRKTIEVLDHGQDQKTTDLVLKLATLFLKIRRIILFGSYATGRIHKFSDIDLAIETEDDATPEDWYKITKQVQIAEKLHKIDCVHFNKAPYELKEAILTEGKVIYERR